MPTLETTAGKTVSVGDIDEEAVTAQFRAVEAGAGQEAEQAPPRRQPSPPAEDKPKRAPRQARAEKSRTTDKPAAPKDDYTEDARNLVGSVWTVTASVGFTQPYALVVESNSDALVAALAEGAKHNAMIRSWVSAGESSWMLGLASVGISMGMQALQVMRDPQLREAAAATTREHLRAAMGAKGIELKESDGNAVQAAA